MELDRPRRRKRAKWPWAAAFVAALGIGGYLAFREGVLPTPPWEGTPSVSEPAPGAPAAPPARAPEPPADENLPPVGESDRPLEEQALQLSTHPAFAGWLRVGSLIRRFVATVDNVADGASPRAQVPFLALQGPFRAREEHGRTVVDPASYARYDLVADAVASLDASACARLYATFRPLLESAYRELGRQDRTFEHTLSLAIDRLLGVPVPDRPVELTPLVTRYEFADPRLESLSHAEKHLLRMGPRNIRLVQGKLREIETALGGAR